MVPEKEGGWKQTRWIQRLEIETVLKRGILTFGPFPDEDIIELMSDSVLDGDKVALIPIPKIKICSKYFCFKKQYKLMRFAQLTAVTSVVEKLYKVHWRFGRQSGWLSVITNTHMNMNQPQTNS